MIGMEPHGLVRADFGNLHAITAPQLIPAPDRAWSADEWTSIQQGFVATEMEKRWLALVEGDRLYIHRSWTRYGIYEAQFARVTEGWHIVEAVVEGNHQRYGRGSDEYETGFLELTIRNVLLNDWDDELWRGLRRIRWPG
jgi:hypothetical protein